MALLQRRTASCLSGHGVLLSILSANTLNLCSPVTVKDQAAHPYKAADKIIILYIVTCRPIAK
jgi:phosphate starvation-inducible membrane PsiE